MFFGVCLRLTPRFLCGKGCGYGFGLEPRLLFGVRLGLLCGAALLFSGGQGFRLGLGLGARFCRSLFVRLALRLRRSFGCSVLFRIDQPQPPAG
ncbi:MAG: hypothetical protein HC870_02470 [Rhizobiales bacterium]|nr:hypothetical protein [Hyphomicrobiales bacterium]